MPSAPDPDAPDGTPAQAPRGDLAAGQARWRHILALSLPIVGGMVSQNVMNLVDTAMVGRLGDAALGAVGTASYANFMCQAFITGLATGVQAMAARRMGQGRTDTAVPLNGGLALAALLAVPWSALLFMLAPALVPLLNDDPAIQGIAAPYLQARLCGMVAVGMNFAFRGYFNGVNLSKLYLRTIVVMHVVNISLNYTLIFGHFGAPALGATGAGIGTTVSAWVGTLTYVVLALRHARGAGFLRALPSMATFKTMLRLSVPSGVQQVFFAAGLTTLFWVVGRLGPASTAAASVLLNVTLVAILPGLGLGLAAASLVGQALGRGDAADAGRWGWDVVRVALLVMGGIGLPMVAVPHVVLAPFLKNPDTLALAAPVVRLVGATIGFDAIALVLQNALHGAGDSRRVMAVSTGLQWGIGLPLAYLLGPGLGGTLLTLWVGQVIYRALQAGVLAAMWRRGRWATIQL